jgi:hypothetical protein
MNCKQARAAAIESARSALAIPGSHFETCVECARFLQAQLALQSAFAVLASEPPESQPAPPAIEARLLAEFDETSRSTARRFRWWLPAAAIAAALAIAMVAIGGFPIHRPVPAPGVSAEPFVEIPYIAPLAPYERTRIVRMNVPVSALIAAGFEVNIADTGAALQADVLFGQDGRAHAIRPISNSVPNSNRRLIE